MSSIFYIWVIRITLSAWQAFGYRKNVKSLRPGPWELMVGSCPAVERPVIERAFVHLCMYIVREYSYPGLHTELTVDLLCSACLLIYQSLVQIVDLLGQQL
jgi:hypothetical protein